MVTVLLLLLAALFSLTSINAEIYSPTSVRCGAGCKRFVLVGGKGSSVWYGPLLKWCKTVSPTDGIPHPINGLVGFGEHKLAYAYGEGVIILGEYDARWYNSYSGFHFGTVLGVMGYDGGVFFYTEDGWGTIDAESEELQWKGGFKPVIGAKLKRAAKAGGTVYSLADTLALYEYDGEELQPLDCPDEPFDIATSADELFVLTAGGRIISYKKERGWQREADGFMPAEYVIFAGRGAFRSKTGLFSPMMGLRDIPHSLPEATGLFHNGLIWVSGGGRLFRDGEELNADVQNWEATEIIETGLMIEHKTFVASAYTYTHEEAVQYCENLQKAGYTDWRLPTKQELQAVFTIATNSETELSYFSNYFKNPEITSTGRMIYQKIWTSNKYSTSNNQYYCYYVEFYNSATLHETHICYDYENLGTWCVR